MSDDKMPKPDPDLGPLPIPSEPMFAAHTVAQRAIDLRNHWNGQTGLGGGPVRDAASGQPTNRMMLSASIGLVEWWDRLLQSTPVEVVDSLGLTETTITRPDYARIGVALLLSTGELVIVKGWLQGKM